MDVVEAVRPDWARSTTTIVPALTWRTDCELLPSAVCGADAVVLVVIDSLGWMQLEDRRALAPRLTQLDGGPATTVAPSTTAAALTSISTGAPPGEHGIVGYRFPAGGVVMNALRWSSPTGDHRSVVDPAGAQALAPMAGGQWTVVSDRQFRDSGFTQAHLGATPYVGFQHPSSIIAEVHRLIGAGVRRVYAYYDGLDHVAHIHGVTGRHYDHELEFCDWLIGRLLDELPAGTALVVTADHGQIDAPELVPLAPAVSELVGQLSGEPRFRWLHARPGASVDLAAAAREAHGDDAWVWTRDEVIDSGLFGPEVTERSRARLGDVALVARRPVGFDDPAERHADRLHGRHGSLTAPEMLVPVLHARA